MHRMRRSAQRGVSSLVYHEDPTTREEIFGAEKILGAVVVTEVNLRPVLAHVHVISCMRRK